MKTPVHIASITKRRRRRSSKRKKTKHVTDHSTCTEATAVGKNQSAIEVGGIRKASQVNLQDTKEVEKYDNTKTEKLVENDFTLLRSENEWTETPFFVPSLVENIEESSSTVDSEPTRGYPITFQEISPTWKRNEEWKKCQNAERDCENIRYLKDFCSVKLDLENTCENCNKEAKGAFASESSLNTNNVISETSLSSMSYCTSFKEEMISSVPCFCSQTLPSSSSGQPKVFWAITKINVYPDNSRTYEVMPLTGTKPADLPEKSDSVFVLLPPKSVSRNLS